MHVWYSNFLARTGGAASISGRVTDATDAIIADAPVTIKNMGTAAVQTVNTDAQGRYSVPDLPIGTYQVQAGKSGLQTSVRSSVVLEVGSSPVVRDFEQLIPLAPGVSTYPAGGSSALTSVASAYSISGTRPEGYANMLDGGNMLNWWQRNAGGNVTGTSLGIERIAEFQTLTGTYGAAFNAGSISTD